MTVWEDVALQITRTLLVLAALLAATGTACAQSSSQGSGSAGGGQRDGQGGPGPVATDDRAALCRENRDSQALLIGNKTYDFLNDNPVLFAHNDVDRIRAFLVDKLCYRDENIAMVKDATYNVMRIWLGDGGNSKGRLWFKARQGRSNIFVYYSGHGVPSADSRHALLVPVDNDPNFPSGNYPVDWLDINLKELKRHIGGGRSVTLMLEACFSGRSAGGPVLSSSPAIVPQLPDEGGEIVRFSAATRTQFALWDRREKLGLFTRVFLDGVNGAADGAVDGVRDRVVSGSELVAYLGREVPRLSGVTSGEEQIPGLPRPSEVAWTFKAGPPPMDKAWAPLSASNDRTRIRQFIETYRQIARTPDQRRILETARARIMEIDWTDIDRSTRASDYRGFVERHGQSAGSPRTTQLLNTARMRIREIEDWRRIEFSIDPPQLRDFIRNYPEGLYARRARQRYDDLDDQRWAGVRHATIPSLPRDYIRLFGDGRHVNEARALITRLDNDMWQRINGSSVCSQFDTYINEFPGGLHVREAESQQRSCRTPKVPQVALYNQLDFWLARGSDLASYHTSDVEQCALRCRNNSGCRAFTFNSDRRVRYPKANCFIKSGRGVPDGNKYAISGLILQPGEKAPVFDRLGVIDYEDGRMTNTDFPGGDLSRSEYSITGNFNLCRLQCIANSRCAGFTFVRGVSARNACWLKGWLGSPEYRYRRGRKVYISGKKIYRNFRPFAVRPWK